MKKKDKNPYANNSNKKITAPNKTTNQPRVTRTEGGDLRIKGGK